MQTVFLERAEVKHFLSKVLEAARKPEVLSKTRCTAWYYAKAKWKNLAFDVLMGRLARPNQALRLTLDAKAADAGEMGH